MPDEPAEAARPSMPERVVAAAVPLFMLLALLVPACLIVPKFERMFKKMELGDLPVLTTLTLLFARLLVNFWYLALPAVGVLGWVFCSWGCATRRRMSWLVAFAVAACVIVLVIGTVGLHLALVGVMEKIGK